MYVQSDYDRQGVGSAVLAHLERYALGAGAGYLELWASINAVEFYERMGYRKTAEETIEKEYEGDRVTLPVVAMRKSFDE